MEMRQLYLRKENNVLEDIKMQHIKKSQHSGTGYENTMHSDNNKRKILFFQMWTRGLQCQRKQEDDIEWINLNRKAFTHFIKTANK